MRAITQSELGGPEVLRLTDVPRPEPGPTEVLVRLTAAGVNPVDWRTRADGRLLGAPPFTLGWDVAGVVERVGYGVTRFAPGDRVFGMPAFPRAAGAYAEYVTARSRELAPIPDGLPDVKAGALPLAALTAWQSLIDTAHVRPGQRVLIHAANGGVGHLALQIAKHAGAHVIGTARVEHHATLADLGADELIDYTREQVVADDLDVVLDLVGGDVAAHSLPLLRDHGLLITVPSPRGYDVPRLRELAGGRVSVTAIIVEPDRVGIEAIAALAAEEALRVRVARTFPLEEAAEAHRLGEAGRIGGGKLVLLP